MNQPSVEDKRRLDAEFRGKTRLLIDESMGETVAKILKGEGYNARFVGELGLMGRSDEDVYAAAWSENRVIITHDPDFLDDRRFPPHRNPGVVVIRPGADGREQQSLRICLYKMTLFATNHASWFRGRKLDFSSADMLTVTARDEYKRILWKRNSDPMIWEPDSN